MRKDLEEEQIWKTDDKLSMEQGEPETPEAHPSGKVKQAIR